MWVMKIEYDPNKKKHGVSFEMVHYFDFDTAIYALDTRFEYGENRFNAVGYMKNGIYSLTFTETEEGIRVISFRKSTKIERKRYEQHNPI